MNPAFIYLAVAVGGALGACSRYVISDGMARFYAQPFPIATLLTNVIGGLLIGVLFVLLQEKALLPDIYKPLLITGFLGGLTTFSTFSLETVNLLSVGRYIEAALYMLLSVVLCVLACFVGMLLAK